MNPFERAILAVAPGWARRRASSRAWVAAYESATPSRNRPGKRESGSGNTAVERAGRTLREQARHLEQNHDLARGALDVLVRNTVGTGIGVEPQPRMRGDRAQINVALAWQLTRLWQDFCRRPEVTWQHDMGAAERLAARTWFRDGEVLAQRVGGPNVSLDHGTKVPYSIELIEPDLLPLDNNRLRSPGTNAITMSVETNGWNRPVAYWVLKRHPGEMVQMVSTADLKRMPADSMLHLKSVDRIGQLRGVTVFASVLGRLEDIKDYEESERVAAKIAASMAAMIVKGAPDLYEAAPDGEARQMRFRAGMVFDDLRPGERVETIDTSRPNPNALLWRQGQLRAVASGVGISYSSSAKDYNGSYSAQRQELVEQYGAYQILAAQFINRFTRAIYEDVVAWALAARLLDVPAGIDAETLADAVYVPPQMPWIDPKKEVEAWTMLEDRAYASGFEIIRRRGANPYDVLDQQARWLAEKDAAGIPPADGSAAEPAVAPEAEPDNDEAPAQRRDAEHARWLEQRHEQMKGELAQARAEGDEVRSKELMALIGAIAAREPGGTTVAVHLPQGLELSIPAPIVNVAPPVVNVEAARAPVVNVAPPVVNVAAPTVNVAAAEVTVQAAAAPAPGATRTVIESRDRDGRADVFVTRPVE
jgi:lambda family phage portal protein